MKKIEKNKLVFASVIVLIMLFMGAYTTLFLNKDKEPSLKSNQIPVPKLEDSQKEYESKLEALDDLKEVRQSNAPSIYDERLLDSSGIYDPYLLEKEKQRVVDSIYKHGRIDYSSGSYREQRVKKSIPAIRKKDTSLSYQKVSEKKMADANLFFHKAPKNSTKDTSKISVAIQVVVNGTQIVKKDHRLELRLTAPAMIQGRYFPKNTILYGFVGFKPNRTLLQISHIKQHPVQLKAYDLQDGNEGIYILNNFQAEAVSAVVDDAIDEINLPSIPQVGVLKKVFKRSNKNVKVTVSNNYKLLLRTY